MYLYKFSNNYPFLLSFLKRNRLSYIYALRLEVSRRIYTSWLSITLFLSGILMANQFLKQVKIKSGVVKRYYFNLNNLCSRPWRLFFCEFLRSHIESKIKVASRSLALIRHSFKYLDKKTSILLYKSLVRPHLEYCSPIWNPTLQYMATSIEKVQRRATKLVYRFDEIPYEERLRGWTSPLSSSEGTDDIITAFKICKF